MNSVRNMLALLTFLLGVSPIHAAQPLTKVVMTTGSFSEREAAMYVAQDYGFFRRYGLDLTFVHVRSGPVGMAAVASGESAATVSFSSAWLRTDSSPKIRKVMPSRLASKPNIRAPRS
jgi:ABC-type nitrate/sulfonate/bicarbonate transport system substrate-binding protein